MSDLNEKHNLRAQFREARRAHVEGLPPKVRALMLHRPPAALVGRVPEGAVVGLYHAHAAEAPTAGYARWFAENGRTVALPWFGARDAVMRFRLWNDPFAETGLEEGPWRSRQPRGDAPLVAPDVVFVPLIGFTARCERLGQGGGHYDRWLAAHPGVPAIGLAWDCQLAETLPLEPHDRPLDAVVTPSRIYEAGA